MLHARCKCSVTMSAAFILAVSAGIATAGNNGGDPHANHKQMMQNTDATSPAKYAVQLSDTDLLDQHGRRVNFKSDVVGDNIVVMDFVYTTCTTVCPVLSAVFSRVQDKLGEQVGRGVRLVSLTVDPVRDNPQRLADYSKKHNAGPGWLWLTGDKPNVDRVLETLGAYTADFTEHPSLVLVGDPRSGQWMRFFGFPDPEQIVAAVNKLVSTRNNTHDHDHNHAQKDMQYNARESMHSHAHAGHGKGDSAL